MKARRHCAIVALLVAAVCGSLGSGCVNPLGPGYTVETQQIAVHFSAETPPLIRITADYGLRNTGNRPLSLVEMRLPAGRRVNPDGLRVLWDGLEVPPHPAEWNNRNSVIVFEKSWSTGERHTLRISYQIRQPGATEPGLNFEPDAFFLPAATWAAEFPQQRGLFGFGGVPPPRWNLLVEVPRSFMVHTSGVPGKVSRTGDQQIFRAVQTTADHYPFVVAGRYRVSEIGSGKQGVHLWTRQSQEAPNLKQAGEHIATITRAYDATFGARAKAQTDLWIVECPVLPGCFSNLNPVTAALLGDEAPTTAEMASSDTLLIDVEAGSARLAATAGPGLAASWLGYGQNPGFYDQVPPLSLLPTFAAAVGREAFEGPQYRLEAIRRALLLVPRPGPAAPAGKGRPAEEGEAALRAKSFLFFYGLQDRYGPESFRRAISEMLYARHGRGFNLNDLIAAFDDETHQNAAEFVRIWMKRPGVPDDFRARYESSAAGEAGVEHTADQR